MKKQLFPIILSAVMVCGAGAVLTSQPDIAILTASAEDTAISKDLILKADTVYDGDLYITGGTLDLNGHSLTVNGTLYQSSGTLVIGKGIMKVSGNFELQNKDGSYGDGELNMYSAGGLLDVDGDVIINTTAIANYQDSGTLRIGGNLSVYNPYGGKGYQAYHNHVTEFKGNVIHEVYFESPDYNYMNQVKTTDGGQILLTGGTTGFTLASDVALADGSVISGSRELNLNGYTLTADGSFTQDGELTVNVSSSNLEVSGNYYQPSGTLVIGKGSAHISGNYELQNQNGSYGGGELNMYSAGGLLDVDGDVIVNTTATANYQDSGTLRIGGNLSVYNPYGGKGYQAYHNHVTEFKGNAIHEVYFESPDYNYMNLVGMGDSGQILLTGGTTGFSLASDVTFANGSTISGSRTLTLNGHTMTVDGDFTENGSLTVDVTKSNLEVAGTYYQPDGLLAIGTGSAHISGNYELQNQDGSYGGGELNMYSAGGLLDVDGNVIINTTATANYQDSGTLVIGGNLSVYNPYSGKGYQAYNNHTTVFKGNAIHEVYFESPDYNYLNLVGMEDNGQILLTGGTTGFTLASDVTFANGSTISGSRTLTLNGHTMAVDGDFIQAGALTVDTAKSNLNVAGTYYQPNGVLAIGTGQMHINGNYELQNQDGSYGGGELNMYSNGGLLDVDGNVIVNTTAEANYQASGTLVIGGDLSVSAPYGGKGFRSYNNHATEFKGGKAHTVNFYDKESYFNIIRLGIGDSLEFTGALSGIAQGSNPALAVSPAEIADVSGLTVTGIKKGEGKITFSNGAGNVSKTLLIVDTVQTDQPIVTPPVEPTIPEVTLLGDVNKDGSFSVSDIILLQKWLLNKPDTHLVNWKNGDFDNNGKINIFDLCLMKRALLNQRNEAEIAATNFNIYTVYNKPTAESTFTVDKEYTVTSLMTYHWNNGKGTQITGTISLLEDGVSMGTWTTVGAEGMYSTPNACWWAYPANLTLKTGHTYTIIDSEPDTWSQNGGSGGQGFFEVQGIAR